MIIYYNYFFFSLSFLNFGNLWYFYSVFHVGKIFVNVVTDLVATDTLHCLFFFFFVVREFILCTSLLLEVGHRGKGAIK